MRKYIILLSYLLLIPLLAFYGCSDDETEQIKPVLEVEMSTLQFSSDENSRTILVTTNVRDWEFELENPSDASWIAISKDGGVKVSVAANTTFSVREAKITVMAADLKEEIVVTQSNTIPTFTILRTLATFRNDGGVVKLAIDEKNTNLELSDWELECSDGLSDWLTVERTNKAITLSASVNKIPAERSGTVTIVSEWLDDIVITVIQAAGTGVKRVPLIGASFSSNASDQDEGQNFGFLVDGNLTTYWHSTWRGNIPLPHWLQVDLREEVTGMYQLYYATRDGSANNAHTPVTFKLMGSTTGIDEDSAWFLIRSFSKDTDKLPTGPGVEYTSPVLDTDKTYRYIRIYVDQPAATGKEFWNMSEFGYYIEDLD